MLTYKKVLGASSGCSYEIYITAINELNSPIANIIPNTTWTTSCSLKNLQIRLLGISPITISIKEINSNMQGIADIFKIVVAITTPPCVILYL